jgi:hypothetical protein
MGTGISWGAGLNGQSGWVELGAQIATALAKKHHNDTEVVPWEPYFGKQSPQVPH